MTPLGCRPPPARARSPAGCHPTTHSWSKSRARPGRSSLPSRICTSSPTASPRSARCSVKPATLMHWTATPAAPAAAPVPLSPPISPWSAWAATLAARSASRRRTTASWESAARRASPAAAGSSRFPDPGHRRADCPNRDRSRDRARRHRGLRPRRRANRCERRQYPEELHRLPAIDGVARCPRRPCPSVTRERPGGLRVAVVVRKAIEEMKGQGAEIVEVSIPNLTELLRDPANGFLLIRQDLKFDLNAYLAAHPSAPVRTLEEVLAAGKFHPAVETNLRNAQAVESRDTEEYLAHIGKRNILREAILKAMADSRVEALAYPTIGRKPSVIGETQMGVN